MKDEKQQSKIPQVSPVSMPDFTLLAGFLALDKRSRRYKRFKQLTDQFLRCAGSKIKQPAIVGNVAQRAASLQMHLETLDSLMIAGKPVSAEAVSRISNSLAKYLFMLDLVVLDEQPEKIDPAAALKRLNNWPKDKQ